MDHSKGTKYLRQDLAQYHKSYAVYQNHFYQSPEVYDIGDESFQTVVINKLEQCDTLKVLSVGAGRGELDCINFRRILRTFARIENTVVEPSDDAINQYKKLLARDDQLVASVSTSWFQTTFEDYRREQKPKDVDRFHFISAVHSLYYMSDLKDTVDCLLELLEDGGVLFIVLDSEVSGFTKIWKQYENFYTPLATPTYTGKMVYSLLDENKTECEIVDLVKKIDITCCFDETSEEGTLLVDFLFHIVDFRSFAESRKIYDSALRYLKSPDFSYVEEGKILLRKFVMR